MNQHTYRFVEMAGMTFGGRVVIRFVKKSGSTELWLVRCKCGKESLVRKDKLTHGLSLRCKSCTRTTHSESANSKDGLTPEYRSWSQMKNRCANPKCNRWKNYGGRGIVVCAAWRDSYQQFLCDMGRRPTPSHSLDRLDVDGNYEPGNCRWATDSEQARNTTETVRLTADSKSLTFWEWSNLTGISERTLRSRHYERGWDDVSVVTRPVRRQKIKKGLA
jgi:hypothetical protein